MPNAFAKTMSKVSEMQPKPSSSGGRPMHEHWYGYEKVYIGGKHAAKCLNCCKTFPNTAKDRLEKHRNKCGTANIEINEMADTEGDQSMIDLGDTKRDIKSFASQYMDSPAASSSRASLHAVKDLKQLNLKRYKAHKSSAGRPMHEHWYGYEKVYIGGKNAAKCLNCCKTFLNTGKARLEKHRKICGTANIEINEMADTEGDQSMIDLGDIECDIQSFASQNMDSPAASSSRASLHAVKEFKQSKLKRYMAHINEIESGKIDTLMAEFFIGCNVPFNVCDSKYFKNLIHALRPSYEIPNRGRLAGQLLDKTHNKIQQLNNEVVDRMDKEATLLVESWQSSSANKHNVVTMLASANNERIMLESFDISLERNTTDKMVEIVKKSIDLAKKQYDAVVYACITDNACNITSMSSHIDILFTTCNAHTANLLAGDILKSPKYLKTMAKVLVVQEDFRRTPLEGRLLNSGGTKSVLSCVTRWTAQRSACVSLLKNLTFMKKVAAESEAAHDADKVSSIRPKSEVTQLLFDETFVASVKALVKMLDPVAQLTNYCQASDVSVADSTEKWLDLLQNESDELCKYVEIRCEKSHVFNNVTMTANLLHPLYRGQKLSESQKKVVNEYVFNRLEGNALESLCSFTGNDGTFAILFKKQIESPKTFWHFARQLGHEELADFATKYLKIPASTAQLERLFSNWAYVHSNTRNRLSPDTSKKLANIYFSLRVNDDITDDCNDEYDADVDSAKDPLHF